MFEYGFGNAYSLSLNLALKIKSVKDHLIDLKLNNKKVR